MDRLERLLNLIAALIDASRPLTTADIRERVPGYPPQAGPAFHRAFERDKETLREMGVPITMDQLAVGEVDSPIGYRILRDRYELPDPGLEPEELAALHFASSAVRLDGTELTEAIWKLGGVEPDPPATAGAGAGPDPGSGAVGGSGTSDSVLSPAPVTPGGSDGGAGTSSLPGSEHLAALFSAATERRTVQFTYRGDTRTVDPWRLGFRNGFWYLTGRDHARDDRRRFRLDRVTSDPVLSEPGAFDRPPDSLGRDNTPPWEMGDEEPAEVQVLVDADQARWAVTAAGEERVEERRADGSIVLRLRVTNRGALRSFVLGFLDHAEILGPGQERQQLVAWLRAIRDRSLARGPG